MVKTNNLRLWWQWVLANALGELVGLGATFAIGFGLFSGLSDIPGIGAALLSAGLMTTTGVLEGGVVGYAQWLVLRKAIPAIGWRSWVIATIIGAVIAWFFGSIPMTLMSLSQPTASTATHLCSSLMFLLHLLTDFIGLVEDMLMPE